VGPAGPAEPVEPAQATSIAAIKTRNSPLIIRYFDFIAFSSKFYHSNGILKKDPV
jgi:hypothetical protein